MDFTFIASEAYWLSEQSVSLSWQENSDRVLCMVWPETVTRNNLPPRLHIPASEVPKATPQFIENFVGDLLDAVTIPFQDTISKQKVIKTSTNNYEVTLTGLDDCSSGGENLKSSLVVEGPDEHRAGAGSGSVCNYESVSCKPVLNEKPSSPVASYHGPNLQLGDSPNISNRDFFEKLVDQNSSENPNLFGLPHSEIDHQICFTGDQTRSFLPEEDLILTVKGQHSSQSTTISEILQSFEMERNSLNSSANKLEEVPGLLQDGTCEPSTACAKIPPLKPEEMSTVAGAAISEETLTLEADKASTTEDTTNIKLPTLTSGKSFSIAGITVTMGEESLNLKVDKTSLPSNKVNNLTVKRSSTRKRRRKHNKAKLRPHKYRLIRPRISMSDVSKSNDKYVLIIKRQSFPTVYNDIHLASSLAPNANKFVQMSSPEIATNLNKGFYPLLENRNLATTNVNQVPYLLMNDPSLIQAQIPSEQIFTRN